MALHVHLMKVPELRYQADIEDARNAAMASPGCEDVEVDFAHREMLVTTINRHGIEDVRESLDHAGFTPSSVVEVTDHNRTVS